MDRIYVIFNILSIKKSKYLDTDSFGKYLKTMLKKILVANRGEIAVRVLRACKELGITTVTVYSEADKNALHTRYADECYEIGNSPATESYLKIDKIMKVAKKSKVQAIHH